MYYKLLNDNKRRRVIERHVTRRQHLLRHFFRFTKTVPLQLKKISTTNSHLISITKVNNRCIKTNYRKSVSSFFGLSRIALRQSFLDGSIPYYRISSW